MHPGLGLRNAISARLLAASPSFEAIRVISENLFVHTLTLCLTSEKRGTEGDYPGMKLSEKTNEKGAMGYILLWLIGIPIPVLLLIFLLRGCT